MTDATGLQMTLTLPGNPDDVVVAGFRCEEALSTPFSLTAELASQHTPLDDSLLGQAATLEVFQNGTVARAFHGVISEVTRGTTGHRRTRYRLILRPALWQLSLTQTSRFFQQQTPQAIAQTLLSNAGITDVQFNVSAPGEVREYCVQYSETDLAFFERLAAEEGWVYYHTFTKSAHTLVITDTLASAPALGSATLNTNAGGRAPTPLLWAFSRTARVAPSRSELKDYTFKRPAYALDHTAQASTLNGQQDDYEHFDYPGRFKKDASGAPYANTRQQYLRRDADTAFVTGNLPGFSAGHAFTLDGSVEAADNQRWLITTVTHQGRQDQALEEDAGGQDSGDTFYQNDTYLIPATATWQATPTPKPRVEGPQIARVTGSEGDEITTDEFGRVKVVFPWDRDEQPSAWVRVAHGWAGGGYGMVTLPRIGHEVIVSFLEGDPDQPIITGRTYNAANTVPAPLPDNKTQTLWRTQTHQGEGYNALRFEDKSGSEHIWQHAQKDLELITEHDRHDDVQNTHHSTTGNISKTRIDGREDLTVKGERRVQVSGDMSHTIGATRHTRASTSWLMEAATVHHKGGHKVVLSAGQTLSLSAGGSFIKLDPSGVTIVGPSIKMNSGGSAGSGPGQNAQVPLMPEKNTD
ncbi:type VI secretion system tip protein TssI/VgrG [Larsenimonas suaedae]|uniref:Type VI secretion system tip protein TssI/VgrG n=1 Tax=Larsenimonas suaedae TaxID=1851019 RepID=A0ABU1GVP5_9GAMM|nr:type VI secretion system tip protein TssI/VgrG [Larsenimonas suaedae]MCM2973222.1 type VI secretion system tip protein VgrG [Larsenimonas suaedae]MDR5896115.1 type VI secretion system tip protein TssI/VgrG [Larsenimonas suaedae]